MSTENAVNQAVAEQSEDRDEWDVRVRQTLEEKGGLMLSDQEDVMEMVFQKLVKLKKAVLEEPQEVLRTRIVSPQELLQEKELWEKPIMEELTQLVEGKGVLQRIDATILRQLQKEHRTVEVVQ